MSSFGCTILHDCLVVPEDVLEEILMVPARGWEHFPGLLADHSQFPIVQVRDVLHQLEVILDIEPAAQVRFVHMAERLKPPAIGWVCVREALQEWHVIRSRFPNLFELFEVMKLSGVPRSNRVP